MARPTPSYLTRHHGSDALQTHRHAGAYAALVLDGSHVECSADGPVHCAPGTLLLHPCFHAHGNRFGTGGAVVLNLPLDASCAAGTDALLALQVPDLREARAVFRHGRLAALRELIAVSRPLHGEANAWQAELVRALHAGDEPIARIAARLGVSSAYASRAIQRAYGMGPQALRRELRWRHALRLLRGSRPLAEVAAEAGFADQSHLHRITLACSGLTPARLRAQVKSVQDPGRSGVAQSA
jgi:AraC family transcriptional regulator